VYLRRGQPDCTVYAIGAPTGPDTLYGVSDIDLVVVTPRASAGHGKARQEVLARWERLGKLLGPLRRLVSIAVFEDPDLERGVSGTPSLISPPTEPSVASDLSQPIRIANPPDVVLRAGFALPPDCWRPLAGRGRLPTALTADGHDPRIAAWLELQHWWHHAFAACLAPSDPHVAYLCVKLAAEPARIWIWLTEGGRVSTRREALARGVHLLPDERETFERALWLQSRLHRSPEAPLADMLAAFLRLSARIARLLAHEIEHAGVTAVRLDWSHEEQLALPARARDPLRAVLGTQPQLFPLADWRSITHPHLELDETFALVPGSAANPETVADAAAASERQTHPALSGHGLLVFPAATAAQSKLRAVQCQLTDPVSFAVVDGAQTAGFPNVGRWSIPEMALHSVAEHRAWLARSASPPARNAGASPPRPSLGRLLSCARAALLLESVEAGAPELALTLAAAVRRFGERDPLARGVAEEALGVYRAWQTDGFAPPDGPTSHLRERVLALPAYRESRGLPTMRS
jgi:hypothetical protein